MGRAKPKGAAVRSRVKVVAAEKHQDQKTYLLFTTLFFIAVLATVLANVARAEPLKSEPGKSLEVSVWTADETQLYKLEGEVVRSLQLEPRSAHSHYLLSHLMTRIFSRDPGDLRLLSLASDLAQQAIDLDSKSDVGYVALADVLDLMGRPERGLELIADAERTGVPPTWRLHFTRARLQGDAASGTILAHLEKALTSKDAEHDIVIPYVTAVLQANFAGEELVAALETWYGKVPNELFLQSMAITYGELGKHQKAHELYEQVYKKAPYLKEARINDAVVLYKYLGKPSEAVALLNEVLQNPDARLSKRIKAIVHAHLGSAYNQLGKFSDGLKHNKEAVVGSESDEQIVDFVISSYQQIGAFKELTGLVESLNVALPGSYVFHAILGETLSDKLSRHQDGLNAFANAIALNPERSELYNGMGLVYYRMKLYNEALRLFSAATKVDPNDATARYNEACALALLGKTLEALGSLQEAVALDPSLQAHARGDSDLTDLHRFGKFHEIVERVMDDGLSEEPTDGEVADIALDEDEEIMSH